MTNTTDNSLSSTLQQINNNNNNNSPDDDGLLAFLTPWKKRKRDAPPASSQVTQGAEPNHRTVAKKARLSLPPPAAAPSTTKSRKVATASRRRRISNFRPMSRYLSSSSRRDLGLGPSLAACILRDAQEQQQQQRNNRDGTGSEEASLAPMSSFDGRAKPRVVMTRVLGGGQTGGSRLAALRLMPSSAFEASAPEATAPEVKAYSSHREEEEEAIAPTQMPPGLPMPPLSCTLHPISQAVVRESYNKQWMEKASEYQLDLDATATPLRSGSKAQTTKKVDKDLPMSSSSETTPIIIPKQTTTAGDNQPLFQFMPSQNNDSITGYNYKSKDAEESTKKVESSIGWGNCFDKYKLKPGEWKCLLCQVKNAIDAEKCVSCDTVKGSADGNQAGASTGSKVVEKNVVGVAFAEKKDGAGFQFGAATPAAVTEKKNDAGFQFGSATAPVTTGFQFGSTASSATATAATAEKKDGAGFQFGSSAISAPTPVATAEKMDGAGFQFGHTAPTPAATADKKDGAGFQFGATTTPAPTPAATNEKKDCAGFQFGATPAATTEKKD
ncbi:hypothetical protein ACHAXN_002789, partial [Cyclotella atomus]